MRLHGFFLFSLRQGGGLIPKTNSVQRAHPTSAPPGQPPAAHYQNILIVSSTGSRLFAARVPMMTSPKFGSEMILGSSFEGCYS